MRPILVATDFSPSADSALAVAAGLAQLAETDVLVLHVDACPERAPLSPDARARRAHARAELDRSRAIVEQHDVKASTVLRPGDPAREILRFAQAHGVGAIVLGMRGGSSAPSPLGSVADRIVRDATQPILIVPLHRNGRLAPAAAS